MTKHLEEARPATTALLDLLRNSEIDIVLRAGWIEVIAYPKQGPASQGVEVWPAPVQAAKEAFSAIAALKASELPSQ